MKVRDVIKRLEADGWYLARVRGDHRHDKHPTKKGIVTVSGHPGKDMPVTREEVEQLMKEALQEHLQMMREEHLPLPQSQTEAEYMDIPLSA